MQKQRHASWQPQGYPINGNNRTEAGGGGGFPGGSLRICPSGQSQQQDPKQPQTPSMQQGGMPGSINYSQQSRPTNFYPRPSQPRAPTRPPVITQTMPTSNMSYQPPTMIPHTYIAPPIPTAGVILPYPPAIASNGRHQSHGGGQGGSTTGAPQVNAYYPTQQQIYMGSTHHPSLNTSFNPHPHPQYATAQYVFSQHMRNSSYATTNSGPHQGVPPQPPPQQPPQQFVVDSVAAVAGGGPTNNSGTGVMITHGHPAGPPQQSQPKKRSKAIPIIDPDSGRDVIEDYFNEKLSHSGESSASPTPHPIQTNSHQVAADFAARVAAVATDRGDEDLPSSLIISGGPIINGQPSTTPPPQQLPPPAPLPPTVVEVITQPSVVIPPVIPVAHPQLPIVQSQPPPSQHQTQPPPQTLPTPQQTNVVQIPPTPPQIIPTVSAMTDSPPVDLPRPKAPSSSTIPSRKHTPIPPSVQPVLESSKKKEKKVVGVTCVLPPHKEEPEEVKKSSFAESINLKNLSQMTIQPQPTPNPTVVPEPEVNGEPEVLATPTVPQSVKHEKNKHEDNTSHQSENRGGSKALQRNKQKKKSNLKELNRRGQEKEGGSDMDAFTTVGNVASPATAPATSAELKPRAPSPPAPAPEVAPSPTPAPPVADVPLQPPVVTQQQQPPPPPPVTIIPPPILNKTVDIEQDEGMVEMEDDDPEPEETDLLVAAKNKENNKVSAATAKEQAITDSNESLVIETTVIERSKPPTLKFSYKEDQWSPLNPEGKKVYDRDFLLGLRTEALSTKRPDIEDCDIIKTDTANNNNSSINNNNRRLHTGSNSMGMSRDGFSPVFFKQTASQRGSMIGGRRSQGRPGGGGAGVRSANKMMYPGSNYGRMDADEDLHWAGKGGWKPERCKSPPKLTDDEAKTEHLYKRVRGILNKLTPQKFDTLLEQISNLPIDTTDRLKGVVELVFDKAVDEPSFSIAYAKLCQHLGKMSVKIVNDDDGENQSQQTDFSFRKVLLTRCQQMFEKKKKEETGEDGKKSEDQRIAELQQAIAGEGNKDKKKELQIVLDEEERKIRVKYVGLARFIGELFKLQMLTANIMHNCIRALLEKIEEESLECLCKLLTTVGKELESQSNASNMELEEYFTKMRKLSQKSSNSKVSSRVRFMLQDVIELRSSKWVPRREENNPKTIEQIHREAERETLLESALLSSTPRSKHNDRDDRRRGPRSGGNNNNNQDSDGWSLSTTKSFRNYAFDQSKLQHLKGIDNESSGVLGSHTQFSQWNLGSNAKRGDGPKLFQNKFAILSQEDKKLSSSMMARKATPSASQEKERAVQGVRDAFVGLRDDIKGSSGGRGQNSNPASRDNSRVRGKTTSANHASAVEQETPAPPVKDTPPMDPEACKKKARAIFEEWQTTRNLKDSIYYIQNTFSSDAMLFVQPLLEMVLEGKATARASFGDLLSALLTDGIVTSSDVTKELSNIIECGEDLVIDLPLFWTYLAELLVPLLAKDVFKFSDLKTACETSKTTNFTKTLAEIFKMLTKEKGPVFIKQQWEASKVNFTDFFPESDVVNFIKTNKCGFLIGEEVVEAKDSVPMKMVEDKVVDFLLSENNDKIFDHICEWIKANVGKKAQETDDFIRALTRAVIKASIDKDFNLIASNLAKHEKLIKRFVDANELRELACLHGIQNLVVVEMLSPKGLLLKIFQSLWEDGIISHEAFIKWKTCEDTKYEAEGKGVAVASLSPFFVSLSEQDDSDDESS